MLQAKALSLDSAATFILAQFGLQAVVLEGGMRGI